MAGLLTRRSKSRDARMADESGLVALSVLGNAVVVVEGVPVVDWGFIFTARNLAVSPSSPAECPGVAVRRLEELWGEDMKLGHST